jgi:EAL domain-containing protein (putative c-di-GMP-specific phosphodiesterase class I)/ActR/RegA family two-component response regulator
MQHHARRPHRLVVLDDEPTLAELIATIARRSGYEVAVAHTAERFLREVAQPVDIVTVDLMVPRTDGLEILRQLAELAEPPEIVLISGLDERVIAGAGLVASEFGLTVRGRLRKPFRASELQGILRRADGPVAVGPGASVPSRAGVRDDLVRSIARDELPLAYQPLLSVKTGAWIGAEALVRWEHPDHGLLQPADFLHLVTDELIASDLTMAVLRRAAREWAAVRNRVGLPLGLSVNVHPLALADPGFATLAVDTVMEAAIDPASVTLEITEVAPIGRGASLATLTRLRMRGFELSIDDFGTGHSSLERLSQVPFTELKVDRSFVIELESNDWARTIVAQSITLARALGLRTVAEGVEHERALSWLRSIGCDMVQGFHLGRPTWPADLPGWLERRTASSSLIL